MVSLALCLCIAIPGWAQNAAIDQELRSIQEVRALLTDELAQFEKTLSILLPDGSRPEDSTNPAVKNLAAATMRLRERLITITEREVALVQQRIAMSNEALAMVDGAREIEGRQLRAEEDVYIPTSEEEDVARLLLLLTQYYTDLQESMQVMPTDEELAQREAARQDAATLEKIPFSADKVRLNGEEAGTALARISQRLTDSSIPESRRDITPICGIKTRLYGSLIASENRSLKPVGKNQYIARIRLQPGDTTLRVQSHSWQVRLPENISARDYVVTLFMPNVGKAELHVFAIEDLLAQETPYIPAWLPEEMNLKPRTG